MSDPADDTPKSRRGFASMDPERRQEISRLGGKSVPAESRIFRKNPELAAAAGRKGGLAVDPQNRQFARNRDLARQASARANSAMRRKPFDIKEGSMGWHVRYFDHAMKKEVHSPNFARKEDALEHAWLLTQSENDIQAIEGPDNELLSMDEVDLWFDVRGRAAD